MHLELVPLLQTERDLYAMPRGWDRFRAYLKTMVGDSDDVALLPLVAMNPMGKEHVAAAVDALIAFDAEGIAKAALGEVQQRLAQVPGAFKVGLVVADDAQGGWTNRYFSELTGCMQGKQLLKRGWIAVAFWTGDTPNENAIRPAVLQAVYRLAYMQGHGEPRTLGELMTQEGMVARFAGIKQPNIAPEELAYIRDVLAAYRDTTEQPTLFACWFGDAAAYEVGYPSLGLPPRAGFALAVAEAYLAAGTPEAALLAATVEPIHVKVTT